jgi:hypothetical protein
VCLPKIADADGNLSYEELVGLVLVFTLPPNEDNNGAAAASGTSNNKYTVSLTYYDDDKDLITVASTDELMEAINLFAGQKFMRITTCVKPKISYSTSSAAAAVAVAAAAAASSSTTAAGSPTVDRGTSTNVVDDGNDDENYPPGLPIQEVLSSFVGILSNAVHHLQKATTQVPPVATRRTSNTNNQKMPPQEPKENATKAAAAAATTPPSAPTQSTTTKVTDGSDRNNRKGLKAKRAAARKFELRARLSVAAATRAAAAASQPAIIVPGGDKEAKHKVSSFKAAAALNTKKEVNPETAEDSAGSPKEESEEEEEEAKPFIHGRHTCDACLTTPIVGERYHSMNLPDYDLCKRCFVNYSGKEIKFEPVELDRDIPFQTRWQYKHQRQIMMMKRRERFGRGGGGGGGGPHHGPRSRRFRGPNHGRFNCRPNGSNDMLHLKPARSPSSQETQEDVPSSTPVATTTVVADTSSSAEQFDNELKEAIRRSLDDVVPKEASVMERGKAKDETSEEDDVSKVLPECSKEKEKDAAKSTTSNEDISTYVDTSAVDVQGDRFRDAEDDIPCSVEIAKRDNIVNEDTTRDDSTMENTFDVLDEPKEVETMEKTMEKSMDTDSVDSEKLLISEDDYTPPTPESISFINPEDVSFSSDAVGNGDIAEAMGKTLDMVAGAISEMLSESQNLKPVANIEDSKETTDQSKMGDLKSAPTIENSEEATTNGSKVGELIVNSNDEIAMNSVDDEEGEDDDDDDDADSDWSVVKSVGSNGTTESEQIAKAAEMLGSALFNSDMKTSTGENISDLMGSDSSFSIPSSVPTDVGGTQHSRLTAPPQPTRWANELEKLRELGFKNESKCIAILERLEESSDDAGTTGSTIHICNIDRVANELLELNE